MDDPFSQSLPWSRELEEELLGCLIRDNKLIDVAAADLKPEHLCGLLHQRTYAAILQQHAQGAVTPVVLAALMKGDGELHERGAHAYLGEIALGAPSLPNIPTMVRALRELAFRRDLIMVGEDLIGQAQESPKEQPAQAIANAANERLLALSTGTKRILRPHEVALRSLQRIEDMHSGRRVPMVPTGWDSVDQDIGGLRAGDFVVILGARGMGKSTFLSSLCLSAARRGYPAIFFSLEMTAEQVVERMLCDLDYETAVRPMHYSRFRNGRLNGDEFERAGAAVAALEALPLEIIDDGELTVHQIAARARAFKAKHGGKMGLVAVDYTQKVTPALGRRDGTREQEVAQIASGLKNLAKQLEWPVVAGSQINEQRDVKEGSERPPRLGDERESKAIGNEADLVLTPWWPAYYVRMRRPAYTSDPKDATYLNWLSEFKPIEHRLELRGLKNRHGDTSNYELWCDMGSSVIRDSRPYARQDQEDAKGLL